MDFCEKKAYAKINLCLDVLGRLENGYHKVRMVMQTVGIYDSLSFEKTEGEVVLASDCTDLSLGEDNLIYKAIMLMKENFSIQEGVYVYLEKRIPIAAGLAGGSTDAACTLLAMNELFELGLSEKELRQLGVKLGADVPFCIMGGTALAEGIGEDLTRLADMPGTVILVAKPNASVSTRDVYRGLDAKGEVEHPDVYGMVKAIMHGDLMGITNRLGNVLESVTMDMVPVIGKIKKKMIDGGAMGSLMSGSGPTVFGIFDEREKAEMVLLELKKSGMVLQAFVTEPV